MSHTVTIDIEMRNQEALAKAALAMGATILGVGTHRLFDGATHTGFAFKLPKWQYPIVIEESGKAHYDDYHGMWGNTRDLEVLKDNYAIYAVQTECDNLGWYHELNEHTGELVIHHPDGGTITVQKGGSLDAAGFNGTSCADATLKLEQAMGKRLGETVKPEMNRVQLTQNELE